MNPQYLELLKVPQKNKKYSSKWWFNGDLPWYKVKNHLKQIQEYGAKTKNVGWNLPRPHSKNPGDV